MHSMKISSDSFPVPQASSGLTGGSPGSSTAARRSRVWGVISVRGTPAWAAASMRWARSPPESWIAERLPAPARRPATNSSSVSAISSRFWTRRTPFASKSASYAPSSPARAPEWAATSCLALPSSPTFRAITGMSWSAALLSAALKGAGSRTVSMKRATLRVLGRSSA